jgi:xeroderma pigmentosum group C-complementing protein
VPGVKLICKRLGVDFGEAMTGWDIVKHYSRPRFEGVVVCAENEEIVIEAWRQDNERKLQQEIKKASERALGRWRLLTRRLLAKHHVASNYLGVGADGQIADEESSTVVKKRGKKAGGASTDKLRKSTWIK